MSWLMIFLDSLTSVAPPGLGGVCGAFSHGLRQGYDLFRLLRGLERRGTVTVRGSIPCASSERDGAQLRNHAHLTMVGTVTVLVTVGLFVDD